MKCEPFLKIKKLLNIRIRRYLTVAMGRCHWKYKTCRFRLFLGIGTLIGFIAASTNNSLFMFEFHCQSFVDTDWRWIGHRWSYSQLFVQKERSLSHSFTYRGISIALYPTAIIKWIRALSSNVLAIPEIYQMETCTRIIELMGVSASFHSSMHFPFCTTLERYAFLFTRKLYNHKSILIWTETLLMMFPFIVTLWFDDCHEWLKHENGNLSNKMTGMNIFAGITEIDKMWITLVDYIEVNQNCMKKKLKSNRECIFLVVPHQSYLFHLHYYCV